ncbi:MAG: hypothetical protein LH609_11250, partial [Rudanella sp.]|nr:hypothetical protein [Rudanella sp.]
PPPDAVADGLGRAAGVVYWPDSPDSLGYLLPRGWGRGARGEGYPAGFLWLGALNQREPGQAGVWRSWWGGPFQALADSGRGELPSGPMPAMNCPQTAVLVVYFSSG